MPSDLQLTPEQRLRLRIFERATELLLDGGAIQKRNDAADHAEASDGLQRAWGASYDERIARISTLFPDAALLSRLMDARTADGRQVGNDTQIICWLDCLISKINHLSSRVPIDPAKPPKSTPHKRKAVAPKGGTP